MNILCISTLTNVGNLHYKRELTLLRALALRGCHVDYYYCDGMGGVCDGLNQINPSSCYICREDAKNRALEAGFCPVPVLGELSHKERKIASEWVTAIHDDQIPSAKYKDYQLGKWCLSSVLTYWRINEISPRDVEAIDWYRKLLHNCLLLALSIEKILSTKYYDRMILYNARMAYVQVPFEIGMANHIKVYTHERSPISSRIFFSCNDIPNNQKKFDSIWNKWEHIPLMQNQILEVSRYLLNRMKGDTETINWYSMTPARQKNIDLFGKYNIESEKTVLTLFVSSTHEIAALHRFQIEGYANQNEWIEKCIVKLNKYPNIHLIIKLHPNMSNIVCKRSAEKDLQYFGFLKKCVPNNVTIIDTCDNISTYDLMDISSVGLCYMSTAGLEMASQGKVVCIGANPYYKHLDCIDRIWDDESLDRVFHKYSIMSKGYKSSVIQKSAYRMWYARLFRYGFEFPFLHYPTPVTARYAYFSPDVLSSGKHEQLDLMCDAFMAGDDPILLPTEDDYKISQKDEDSFFSNVIEPSQILSKLNGNASFITKRYMPIPVLFVISKDKKKATRSLSALAANKLADDTELHIIQQPDFGFEDLDLLPANAKRFKNISWNTTSSNHGYLSMVIESVNNFLKEHESVIILDDNLYFAPQTLLFLNKALFRYRYQRSAFCVSASNPDRWSRTDFPHNSDVIFVPETDAMGFGIWQDRWSMTDKSVISEIFKSPSDLRSDRHLLAELFNSTCIKTHSLCVTPRISYTCFMGPDGVLCRKKFSKIPEKARLPYTVTPHMQSAKNLDYFSNNVDDPATKHIHHILEDKKHNNLPVFLNIGCGQHYHEDWINLDMLGDFSPIIPWNLLTDLPLPRASCDAIYSCHSLEHFDPRDAKNLLLECRRVLKPNGILRLVVPDLENISRTYLSCLDEVRKNPDNSESIAKHQWMIIELVDQLARHESGGAMARAWAQEHLTAENLIASRMGHEFANARKNLRGSKIIGGSPKESDKVGKFRLGGEVHQWMYDEVSLRNLLLQCGFKNIHRRDFDQSGIQDFSAYELDTLPDGDEYRPFSLYIEAMP